MESRPNHRGLAFTGERVVPGVTPRALVLEHLLRYRFAATLVNAVSKVLDVGCGTGYGAALLAEKAAGVVGIDSAWEAIQYARGNYFQQNLSFACADCRDLPFRDHSFDQAVLFEVIEHISEQTRCLSEIRRVLTPEGMLILSTPNAASPTKEIEEANPFHKRELQEQELLELLRPHFGHVQLLYQHEVSASSIEASASTSDSRSAEVVEDFCLDSAPKYFIAVCSRQRIPLPSKKLLAMGGIEHQVAIVQELRQQQREIEALRQWGEEKERDIEALRQWGEEKERDYARNLAAHQEVIARLKEEVARLVGEVTALEREIAARDAKLAELENENARRRMELEWLYRWLPTNRLARKLLYGRDLRRRVLRRLGFKV
jgi:SAM-dependent methyltransferase